MRTTLVPAVLALLVVMPIGAQDARPSAAPARSFAAATVKLNRSGLRQRTIGFEPGGRFVARNMPLRVVIGRAFGGGEVLPPYLIDGAPPWIETEPYDIEAVPDAADLDGLEEVRRRDALLEMLRDLLETRFGLRARWEPRERPVYALV